MPARHRRRVTRPRFSKAHILPPMTPVVVLDANALHGKKPFTRADTMVLLALAKTGLIRLVIPDVMLRELSRQWADSIAEATARIESAVNSIDAVLGELSGAGASVKVPVTDRSSLHAAATAILIAKGVEIPSFPAVSVADLLERDLDRRKPFGKDGKGFRDALLWETVKVVCAGLLDPADLVLFVTANSKDFCDDTGDLHPDLRAELPAGQAFQVVQRLNLLLEHEMVEPLAKVLGVQNSIEPALLVTLVDDAFADPSGRDLASILGMYDSDGIYAPAIPTPLDDPSFEEILIDEGTIIFDVFLTGDPGEMTLRVAVEADCSIEGFIHKSDYYIVDSGEVRVLEDWNDHMFRASEQRRLRFTLSGDFPEDTVDDITLTVDEVEDVSS